MFSWNCLSLKDNVVRCLRTNVINWRGFVWTKLNVGQVTGFCVRGFQSDYRLRSFLISNIIFNSVNCVIILFKISGFHFSLWHLKARYAKFERGLSFWAKFNNWVSFKGPTFFISDFEFSRNNCSSIKEKELLIISDLKSKLSSIEYFLLRNHKLIHAIVISKQVLAWLINIHSKNIRCFTYFKANWTVRTCSQR